MDDWTDLRELSTAGYGLAKDEVLLCLLLTTYFHFIPVLNRRLIDFSL
jgi:hypothetical protein